MLIILCFKALMEEIQMKLLKKIVALLSAVVILLTFAGCHKKDEVAVTVNGVEFTSAYYMCAFIDADSQAQKKVDEMAEEDSSIDTSKKNYYYSQKIDGKKYQEWVKDTAIEALKKIAAYKIKCKENNVTINESNTSNVEQYAAYYWSYYGYSELYEPNGVSFNTYRNFMLDSYYTQEYFEFLYGKEGKNPVTEEEIKNFLSENYAIANVLYVDLSSLKGEAKTEKIEAINGYAEDIKAGKLTFEDAYYTENPTEKEEEEETTEDKQEETATDNKDETTKDSTEDTNEEEKNKEPLDKLATLMGSKNTQESYQDEYYDRVKKMTVGEVVVVKEDDESAIALLIKGDIMADPYYLENYDMTVRHDIKDEDYEKEMEDFAKTLKAEVNNYAVDRFKAKKIVYPKYSY